MKAYNWKRISKRRASWSHANGQHWQPPVVVRQQLSFWNLNRCAVQSSNPRIHIIVKKLDELLPEIEHWACTVRTNHRTIWNGIHLENVYVTRTFVQGMEDDLNANMVFLSSRWLWTSSLKTFTKTQLAIAQYGPTWASGWFTARERWNDARNDGQLREQQPFVNHEAINRESGDPTRSHCPDLRSAL